MLDKKACNSVNLFQLAKAFDGADLVLDVIHLWQWIRLKHPNSGPYTVVYV